METKVTKTKVVSKEFKTLAKVCAYQNRLYNKYESVQLVSFPRYAEQGTYVWEVRL